ncbi:alpha/beta fold hydrolase [Microbaculum marinum]|uniref:alpha/beta fold hydrolase n=1 Tax=Microbaculum marinum TaxID=1764581 RepID=UPI00360BD013
MPSAIKRGLSIKADLGIRSPLVVWCWPSMGDNPGYNYDSESVEWTRYNFLAFIDSLLSSNLIKSVNVISHSMGGRLGIASYESFRNSPEKLRNIVFVAPDVPQSTFSQRSQFYANIGRLKTLYAGKMDKALLVSQAINGETRAGIGGRSLLIMPDFESIDITVYRSCTNKSYSCV